MHGHLNVNFHYNLTRITGTLHEDLCTFVSPQILLRIVNVSQKHCRENQNIFYVQFFFIFLFFFYFFFIFFFLENHTVCKTMWKRVVQADRPQVTISRTHIAWWISKPTKTHIHTICNTYCFSTATLVMVTRTRFSVMFIRTLPVLLSAVFLTKVGQSLNYTHRHCRYKLSS